jgi:hypothetical protein
MENTEKDNRPKDVNQVPFWGGENEDKQDFSMDWDHDGQFWIALPFDRVEVIVSLVREMLSQKLGGDWPEKPSPKASGRYMGVRHNHYLFANFTRKGFKERFAEVHATETGRTIFVRFWQGLLADGKAALERGGFQYHTEIPQEYKVKVPGLEISPEQEIALEKFRTSAPLAIPEGKLEGVRTKSNSWIGVLFVVVVLALAAFLLREQLGQLFVKEEPLQLGTILTARPRIAAFEQPDGQLVYALAPDDVEMKLKPENLIFGGLIDSLRSDFYSIRKIQDPQGIILYQAHPEVIVSIPDFKERQELNEYKLLDTSTFRHDRKTGWEKYRDQKVILKGDLLEEEDGFYLAAGDGYIKITTANSFILLNLQLALKKGQPVTVYGTVGATYDWKEIRKESRKMFRLQIVPINYETLTASS